MNPVIKGEVIPPDVLAAWLAVNTITTEPVRYGEKAEYVDTGSKHILINGVRWATIKMTGHGCHGPSYTIQDTGHHELTRTAQWGTKAKPHPREVPITTRTLKHDRTDTRSARQKMLDMIPELVIGGELRSPDVIAAERKAAAERIAKVNREENEAHEGMRDALESLARRPDLTNAECIGLARAFSQLFHEPMGLGPKRSS